MDEHTKQEAVLGAALKAHGDDSANLDQDNVDVSFALSPLVAPLDAAGWPNFCCKCLAQHRFTLYQDSASPITSMAILHYRCGKHSGSKSTPKCVRRHHAPTMLQAQDLATVRENESQCDEHETHKMTLEQLKQKELDDLAAGKSDADFEQLLSKVSRPEPPTTAMHHCCDGLRGAGSHRTSFSDRMQDWM